MVTMVTAYSKGQIYNLDVNSLLADPQQPRKYLDPGALNELAASIQKHGVLQPILFRQDDQGSLFIVAGERRLAASKQAGITTIPGIYVEGKHREISLVENLLRENLTPVEEAEGMKLLMVEEGYNQYQLADMLGKTQSSVSKTLTITNLPEDILNQARSNPNIPKTVLMEAAGAKTEKGMRAVFDHYMAQEAKKSAAPTPAKPRVPKETAFINQAVAFNDKLANLQPEAWSEENRQELAVALQDVRRTAASILQTLGIEGTEEGEPQLQ
ncbi:MAG: ParB/RepB/Spo0J family partition protein [Deltaproteobacteria bacterium]|nr:ParB/RepB/Spo0J family partition protein [Deltaproteobacteria bacterium]